jgi:predicted ATP-grasp superfamily ATP-dependent carboligase
MGLSSTIECFKYKNDRNDVPAIVLGCHKIGLGTIRGLGIKGIPVVGVYYNTKDMGFVSKYVIDKLKVHNPITDEDAFIDDILSLSSKYKGSVLFASDDATLQAVSKHKAILKDHFIIEAPDWDITSKLLSKELTYSLANEIGVRAPKTYLPKDFKEAQEISKEIGFPCILKPTVSHLFFNTFKKKMLFINNLNDLEGAFENIKVYNQQMMLQEFIPGNDNQGVNYNSFINNGITLAEFTSEKVRLTPPQIGFPRVIISKKIDTVIEPGRKILNALKYQGFSCTEFKKDSRTGEYVLMEINGRQNFSASLAVRCGLNFPYITYRQLIDGSIPQVTGDFLKNIYWIDPGKDFVESIRSYKKEKLPLLDYLKPYINHNVCTIPDLKDIKPFLKRIKDVVLLILKFLFNKPKELL